MVKFNKDLSSGLGFTLLYLYWSTKNNVFFFQLLDATSVYLPHCRERKLNIAQSSHQNQKTIE